MEFQKLIETRRTVRKYAADSEVTREQMETLIRAAQEAPVLEKLSDRTLLLCSFQRNSRQDPCNLPSGCGKCG